MLFCASLMDPSRTDPSSLACTSSSAVTLGGELPLLLAQLPGTAATEAGLPQKEFVLRKEPGCVAAPSVAARVWEGEGRGS